MIHKKNIPKTNKAAIMPSFGLTSPIRQLVMHNKSCPETTVGNPNLLIRQQGETKVRHMAMMLPVNRSIVNTSSVSLVVLIWYTCIKTESFNIKIETCSQG